MAVYDGPPFRCAAIDLVSPDRDRLLPALAAADIRERGWYGRAASDDTCLFFGIERGRRPVGQIVLHDIDRRAKEAMVAYHVFQPADRGHGTGTAALRALCNYAFRELGLRRLVIITSLDNVASRRIAEKCDFRELGPVHEGPELVGYESNTSPSF